MDSSSHYNIVLEIIMMLNWKWIARIKSAISKFLVVTLNQIIEISKPFLILT